ncbi:hypothetical protein PI124_g23176 [Phytophthora idaei]|nr:hypothetical protein PI125_g25219 [Phytophthora idaei]KAG3130045.1 hypothetical protein PI126_g20672 [Phytophthora idaei]KAG3231731.1 hypothetical protein PI124_g23176 [Phytophthora idaei]
MNWYLETLETSTEAKRADRNFRESEGQSPESPHAINSMLPDAGSGVNFEGPAEDAMEREFIRNVCVGLEETDVPPAKGSEEVGGTLLFSWRSKVRNWVYELLKREQDVEESRPLEGLESDGVDGDIPPLRDKVEGDSLDEESLRDHLVDVGGTLSEAFLNRILLWARRYYEAEAASIRDRLSARKRKPFEIAAPVVTTVETSPKKKVSFDLPMKTLKSEEPEIAEETLDVYTVNAKRAPKSRGGDQACSG